MKIEIELKELEALRHKLIACENEIQKLEKELKEISEEELIKKATMLSYRLFDNYMEAVFKSLGFEQWQKDSVIIIDNLPHLLGKNWWGNDRVNFELGATVTTQFRYAFLKIGVTPKQEDKDRNDDNDDVYKLI